MYYYRCKTDQKTTLCKTVYTCPTDFLMPQNRGFIKIVLLAYLNILILHTVSGPLYVCINNHSHKAGKQVNLLFYPADMEHSESQSGQTQYYGLGIERKVVQMYGQ